MKILVCGYSLKECPRYEVLFQALRQLPIELIDRRRTETMGKWHTIKYGLSLVREAKNVDQVFIFSGNYLLVLILCLFKHYHSTTITFDLHISAYLKKRTPFNFLLERTCGKLADKLLCVTPEYYEFYRDKISIKSSKLIVVPDAVQDVWLTHPKKEHMKHNQRVIYWGNFLPHHNIGGIFAAAISLPGVDFYFCGQPSHEFTDNLNHYFGKGSPKNIKYMGYLPIEDLIDLVDTADICFGNLKDIKSDIHLAPANKQLEAMAREKTVISIYTYQLDNTYKESSMVFVADDKTSSLVNAIKALLSRDDWRKEIGTEAKKIILENHTIENVREKLKGIV